MRVLLVEDDEDLSFITAMQLRTYNYEVVCAKCGAEARKVLQKEYVDVVLLDVMLPDADGHDLCEEFRQEPIAYTGPIIFMSCLGDSGNIVDAFRRGGNDYVVKPVNIKELIERIEANCKTTGQGRKLWYKQFMVDKSRHAVYHVKEHVVGEQILLSPTEYNILMTMIEQPDEVILYRQLYKDVWDQEDLGDVRTLMVHVSNLRKKIDQDHSDMIRAIRGVGYLFSDT